MIATCKFCGPVNPFRVAWGTQGKALMRQHMLDDHPVQYAGRLKDQELTLQRETAAGPDEVR